MPALVFDVECVGEDFEAMDETTQAALTDWIADFAHDEKDRERMLQQAKDRLGLSPLTGEIVALGVLDVAKDQGTVFYQTRNEDDQDTQEDNYAFKPMSERDLLQKFWDGARHYDTFVTFNGRGFDVPYIMTRSAIHGVKPTKNLMSNRYLNSQWSNAKHVDLYDQLSFYGAVRRAGSLHLWCRALDIESPKTGGVKGDDVAPLYARGRLLDIARYNVRDLVATKLLYEKWLAYFNF